MLDAICYGDRVFLHGNPELHSAQIRVHFHAKQAALESVEAWGLIITRCKYQFCSPMIFSFNGRLRSGCIQLQNELLEGLDHFSQLIVRQAAILRKAKFTECASAKDHLGSVLP